jgi:16S rRNA processing protein RimM
MASHKDTNPVTYKYQILLGRISRVNGYDGSVTVKLEKDFIENIPEMESVFLEIHGKPVPFFISSSEYSGSDILRIRFEGYDSYEKANEFSGCKVFLTTTKKNFRSETRYISIDGFKVYIGETQFLGTIEEVIHNPGQDLMRIISAQNKEILVPFHEDFILETDFKNGSIKLILPEGLTELN